MAPLEKYDLFFIMLEHSNNVSWEQNIIFFYVIQAIQVI